MNWCADGKVRKMVITSTIMPIETTNKRAGADVAAHDDEDVDDDAENQHHQSCSRSSLLLSVEYF